MARLLWAVCAAALASSGVMGVIGVAATENAHATTHSLEAFLRFTTRNQLVSWDAGGSTSPDASRLAWVEVTGGVANVFGASRAAGTGSGAWVVHQHTFYTRDAAMDVELLGFNSATVLHYATSPSEGVNALNLVRCMQP